MKGLFIPEITSEMFRNGCLESIEALMAEGDIYDIEYSRWVPVSERLPEDGRPVLIYAWNVHHVIARYESFRTETGYKKCWVTADAWNGNTEIKDAVIAWMPLPEPYKAEGEEEMGKQADKQWGEMWSREKEMECHIALRALARCVFIRWRNRIKQECDTNGEWIAGNSHDIWNLMYTDMKALYTLEQLVNNHYKTRGIDNEM